MQSKYIWILAVFILLCIMLFCNRKVRLWSLLIEQIRVFRNDKKKRISLWDCICFLVFPMLISLIFVYKLDFTINNNLAELLTTVFSIVFTVLFGFAAIMISKIDSQNKTEKQKKKTLCLPRIYVPRVLGRIPSLFTALFRRIWYPRIGYFVHILAYRIVIQLRCLYILALPGTMFYPVYRKNITKK